jgi:uncharacterized RDD family membrane protein YckC
MLVNPEYNVVDTSTRLVNAQYDGGTIQILILLLYFILSDYTRQFDLGLKVGIILSSTIATVLIYYTFSEFIFGKTIGKIMSGTQVISIDGSRPNFKQCLVRSLVRLIPYDTISIYFGKKGVCLHDYLSKTMVVATTGAG